MEAYKELSAAIGDLWAVVLWSFGKQGYDVVVHERKHSWIACSWTCCAVFSPLRASVCSAMDGAFEINRLWILKEALIVLVNNSVETDGQKLARKLGQKLNTLRLLNGEFRLRARHVEDLCLVK